MYIPIYIIYWNDEHNMREWWITVNKKSNDPYYSDISIKKIENYNNILEYRD